MRRLALSMIALAVAGCDQQWSSEDAQAGRAETAQQDVQSTGSEVATFGNGVQIVESEGTVEETVARLETALEENGFSVVAKLNHADNAEGVDLSLTPAVSIFFGKPEVGTYLMQSAPVAALDLPQRMAVFQDGETVKIAYNSPVWLASRHGIEGEDERLQTIAQTLEILATTAAGERDPAAPDGPGDGPLIMEDEATD